MATKPFERISKPLLAPTRDEITTVLDGLEHKWSSNALGVQQRFTEAIARDDASSAQRWAVAGGISTEKVLLMKGRPTEIVANLHAHRIDLAPLMDKLAASARILDQHKGKGYLTRHLPADVPAKASASASGQSADEVRHAPSS